MKQSKLINCLGTAHSGKSTLASQVFSELKLMKVDAELVTEFAKELVWEEKTEVLRNNQLFVSGTQLERVRKLNGKVDVIITDSPIILGAIYEERVPGLDKVLLHYFNQFSNVNFLLEPILDSFNQNGRVQTTVNEIKMYNQKIVSFLLTNNIDYTYLGANENRLEKVIRVLKRKGIISN